MSLYPEDNRFAPQYDRKFGEVRPPQPAPRSGNSRRLLVTLALLVFVMVLMAQRGRRLSQENRCLDAGGRLTQTGACDFSEGEVSEADGVRLEGEP